MESNYEKDRQTMAKDRLKKLCEELRKKYNISQGDIARKIYSYLTGTPVDKSDPCSDIRQDLSKYKNTTNLRENGDYHYPFSVDSAKLICNAINKYPIDSEIHAGADIRWQWLSAVSLDENEPSTYIEKEKEELRKEIVEEGVQLRRAWEEAPFRLLEESLDKHVLILEANIDPAAQISGMISEYNIKGSNGVLFTLPAKDVVGLENELRSYADYLISRELQKRKTPGNSSQA